MVALSAETWSVCRHVECVCIYICIYVYIYVYMYMCVCIYFEAHVAALSDK